MRSFDKVEVGLMFAFVFVLVVWLSLVSSLITRDNIYKRICTEKGGVIVQENVCVDKSSIITI
jgi:hypothetical protein